MVELQAPQDCLKAFRRVSEWCIHLFICFLLSISCICVWGSSPGWGFWHFFCFAVWSNPQTQRCTTCSIYMCVYVCIYMCVYIHTHTHNTKKTGYFFLFRWLSRSCDHLTGTDNTDYITSIRVGENRWEMVGEKKMEVQDKGSRSSETRTFSILSTLSWAGGNTNNGNNQKQLLWNTEDFSFEFLYLARWDN